METGNWSTKRSPIPMVDAQIYYFVQHSKVGATNCISTLKNISRAFRLQAFIHLLRLHFKTLRMLIYVFGFSNFFVSIFQITFDCLDQNSHYHIPLLLNPYGYTTYRGSWIHYCAYFESPSPSEIKSSSTTDNFNFMYQIKRLRNELEWTIQRAFSMLFNFIQGIRSIKMRNIIIVYIVWPPFWIGVEPR